MMGSPSAVTASEVEELSRISVFGWAGGSWTTGAGSADFFDRDFPAPFAELAAPAFWSAGCGDGCSI
jgi:hypothetical protein